MYYKTASWEKIIFIILLFMTSITRLDAESMTITYPNYLKMFADGYFNYTIEFDEDNCITSISSDNSGIADIKVTYNKDKSINDIVSSDNKHNPRLDDVFLNIENNETVTYRLPTKFYRGLFRNSINYIYNEDTDEIFYKYEYKKNTDTEWIVYYTTEDYFDEEQNLYSYSVWEEYITIKDCRKEYITKQNLSILRYYNYHFPFLLYPFCLGDSAGDYSFNSYSCTSFLTEGKTKYFPENLNHVSGLPWASANGFGIGDKIIINLSTKNNLKLKLYNGFQSSEKKYLYEENSRVKTIKVKCLQTGKEKTLNIKDSPEGQVISIDDLMLWYGDSLDFEIEIIDVYPGSKYKDLCIQAIVPFFE